MNLDIRPMALSDLAALVNIDHSYHTDYVWQMEFATEENEVSIRFKEVRLPRSMRVEYPWPDDNLAEDWQSRGAVLVALENEQPVGYAAIRLGASARSATISDLVVLRRLRRHGIGSALLQAAANWLAEQGISQILLEMQSKNHPAISLANKLGFEFCGYSDQYYPNQDIALFFAKKV